MLLTRFLLAIYTGLPSKGGRFFMIPLLLCMLLMTGVSCDATGSPSINTPTNNKKSLPVPTPAELKVISELEAVDINDCRALLGAGSVSISADMVITVRTAVDAMGIVRDIRIFTSTFPHKRFEACVLRTLKSARLTPPGRSLSIDAGFALKK